MQYLAARLTPCMLCHALQLGRIGFFKKYAAVLGVRLGPNLNCADQRPYGGALESGAAAGAAGAGRAARDASE